jgi:hypothetical protein
MSSPASTLDEVTHVLLSDGWHTVWDQSFATDEDDSDLEGPIVVWFFFTEEDETGWRTDIRGLMSSLQAMRFVSHQ